MHAFWRTVIICMLFGIISYKLVRKLSHHSGLSEHLENKNNLKTISEKMFYLSCRMASVSPWSRGVQRSNEEVKVRLGFNQIWLWELFPGHRYITSWKKQELRTYGWLLMRGGRPQLLKRKRDFELCGERWSKSFVNVTFIIYFSEISKHCWKVGGGHTFRKYTWF